MSDSPLFERIYPRLPVVLQNATCWFYGRRESRDRFGALFDRHLRELMESEKWSAAEIEAYQNEKVRGLVRYAYENVPFYRDRWQSLGITPDDIRSRDDLVKLPVLTKEDVRENLDRLLSRSAIRRDVVFKHTSGTSGKALHFYVSRGSIPFQWAVWWRHRLRFGVQPGSWHANFTGKRVVPLNQHRPPYWRWNRPMHQALLNMHHLTPGKIGSIVEFLNSNRFEFYSGYPSIIHMLAAMARAAGVALTSKPRAVFTGAENMLDFQRRDIAEFTGAILTDQYGASEGCGNASQCPQFVYHEDFEFGILEGMERAPGDPVRSILATGFASEVFPFIRYEIGDTAAWQADGAPCACGRSSRMLSRIEGRMDDYVVTPEGARIMRFDYIFKDALNVKEAQVVQRRLGEITVRLVRRPGYSQQDESDLRVEFGRWVSPALALHFEYVPEIERERNGKFRAVLSRLGEEPPMVVN
jgi:phenylacetate-CoA ligase